MGIIIHHPDAVNLALGLEAALGSVEHSQAFRHLRYGQPQLQARHHGSHGIEYIVASRHMELHLAKIFSLVDNIKGSPLHGALNICSLIISLAALNCIGDNPRPELIVILIFFYNIADIFIVKAHNPEALRANLAEELGKCLDDILHGAIMVHVVILHIGHNAHIRIILQESAIAFICLGHQVIALAQLGVAAQVIHLAADDDAW